MGAALGPGAGDAVHVVVLVHWLLAIVRCSLLLLLLLVWVCVVRVCVGVNCVRWAPFTTSTHWAAAAPAAACAFVLGSGTGIFLGKSRANKYAFDDSWPLSSMTDVTYTLEKLSKSSGDITS
jgi:hypothetical protein